MKTKKSNLLNIFIVLLIVIIITIFVILYFNKNKVIDYKIVLQGDRYITLNEGERYIEPGYIAYANDEIVTDKVIVTNEVNTSIAGVYKILYKIDSFTDYRLVEVKRQIDYNLEITIIPNITTLTNSDVSVNVIVSGESFYSLILPDKRMVFKNDIDYTIKENGTYTFEAINDNNESFIQTIEITNIDKTPPTGTCYATLTNTNTSIEVLTNEENIIYSYYDNNTLLNSDSINKYTSKNKTSDKITVIIEDKALNKSKMTCKITDNRYYEQVKPSSNEKVVYHADTETLKTYIISRGTYYLTYIWVKNAYTQLNKYDSPEYGKKLYLPSTLLSKANSTYGLNNKLVIGFNASGFYLKGRYDIATVNKYPMYDKTSVGTLVITNGKVVRNYYDKNDKTWFTIGVNKDNKLLVFEDKKSFTNNERKDWSLKVIDSGIRNTFTFAAPLIENGKETNITTSMPPDNNTKYGLQIICQINDNNFVLFTTPKSIGSTRNIAIREFKKLGCQTAMNLDGGGSVALLYKSKNSSGIKTVTGNKRELTEVGYFTE